MRGTTCTLGDQVVVILDDQPAEDGTVNVHVLPTRGLTVKLAELVPVPALVSSAPASSLEG